jgi:hypothetical protein
MPEGPAPLLLTAMAAGVSLLAELLLVLLSLPPPPQAIRAALAIRLAIMGSLGRQKGLRKNTKDSISCAVLRRLESFVQGTFCVVCKRVMQDSCCKAVGVTSDAAGRVRVRASPRDPLLKVPHTDLPCAAMSGRLVLQTQ